MDAIRDFADADDLRRLNGAEDGDYEAAGLPWGAKDAPFAAVEEVQQVLGMNAPLYEQVAPALTVYTGSDGIDPDVAPRAVLLALPQSIAEDVDDFLASRGEAPVGSAPEYLAAGDYAARARAKVYTIRAQAASDGGATFVREAVVQVTRDAAKPMRLHAWRRGTQPFAVVPADLGPERDR